METIKSKFIKNIEGNQQEATQTSGQSKNINEGIDPVLSEVSPGELEMVEKHGYMFGGWQYQIHKAYRD